LVPAHLSALPSTLNTARLHQPPDRDLWLGDLREESFDEVLAMDEGSLAEALAAYGRDLPGPGALDELLGPRPRTPEWLRHLLLVARFLEQKKTVALEIVAREHLSEDVLEGLRTPAGRLNRLITAILLYVQAPEHLLALLLWDRWHSRRRVSWRLDGRHRHLPDLEPESWREVAEAVTAELSGATTFHEVQLRAVLRREETGELLFGLREPAHRAAVEADDGALVSGRTSGWLLVALRDDGARLDVCDHDPARGVAFATRLLRATRGGEVCFVPAQDALDETRMEAILSAACDPADDRLPLLALSARVPGRTDRVVLTVTGPGQSRAERTLADVRRSIPLGMDWRDVITLKVGFEGRYRFTMEAGEHEGDLALWYSDRERNKDVARRFEDHLRWHFGVSVVPRPFARRPALDAEKAPTRGSATWWRSLLTPLVDAPATWTRAAWAELEKEGLIEVRRSAVMPCGTPHVDARACGLDEHDCEGEIELGWAEVDPDDPLRQPPDAEATCPVCDRVWRPGNYRLPLVERARVEVDVDQLGLRVLRAVASVVQAEPFDGEPGVIEVRSETGRYFVAFAPLLRDRSSFGVGEGLPRRTAWVVLDGDPGPGIPVSQVLADPTVLGSAWGMPALAEGQPPRERGLRDVPVLAASSSGAVPTRCRLTQQGRVVCLGPVPVLAAQANALRALLAIFVHLAQEDARTRRAERKAHSNQRIVAECALVGLNLTDADVRLQMRRINTATKTALVRKGWASQDLIERHGNGYRLAENVDLAPDLSAETMGGWRRRL